MSLLAWIVLGLVCGFVASKSINRNGEGLLIDGILGVVGAVAAGWLLSTIGMVDVSALNVYSVVVAIVGAMAILVTYHVLIRGTRVGPFR